MINLETLTRWLSTTDESEHLEFKEAKHQFDTKKLLRYCVALANEGGGHLVLGISDKQPRQIVGSKAFSAASDLNRIKGHIVQKLSIRVDTVELAHPDGRVLVFEIPSRPLGHPLDFNGAYLMRAGDGVVPMTADRLRVIFAEGGQDWFSQAAKQGASDDEVISLLDTQAYFDFLSNHQKKRIGATL